MGEDFKRWRDTQRLIGLDKACFGCLRADHGWRRDFGNCPTDECPICRTKFADSKNGHTAMDCYSFPQTPADLGKVMGNIDSAARTD